MTDFTMSFEEYQGYWFASRKRYLKLSATLSGIAFVAFALGTIAVYFGYATTAVVLLAICAFFASGVSQQQLLYARLEDDYQLALLVNKHTKDLESLKKVLERETA